MDKWTKVARDRYTIPAVMAAHLETETTVYARFTRAREKLRIARSPEGRFGLTAADCVDVRAYLEAEVDRLWSLIGPVVEAYRAHREASIARGEASDQRPPFDDFGLGIPMHTPAVRHCAIAK